MICKINLLMKVKGSEFAQKDILFNQIFAIIVFSGLCDRES
jgi:hypothetical protein